MLRQYLISRSLQAMEQAGQRRREAVASGWIEDYRRAVRAAVQGFYGALPVGPHATAPVARTVSAHEKAGYRIENVLFDSFPGWEVNASVYVPLEFQPPFPPVIVPVGHSGKQFESYQLPCQVFARNGYLAVVFDPPGQAGEKQPGNDHFSDGVRCYPVGETSSRYFVADALRCVDYALSREDVDGSGGVAMTGVSGGGTTTTLAGLLDDRVSVLGPSCCVTPLADLDISQCYAGCPETHMWRRYAEGIDEIDLLCAAVPKPVLLMAGEQDEVFRIEDTRALAEEARAFYQAAGVPERFEFFADPGGHAYSMAQARRFVSFMNRWLRGQPGEASDIPDEAFTMDPAEHLCCHPRTDVNMRTLSVARAAQLREARGGDPETVRRAAAGLVGAHEVGPPESETGPPFLVWTHHWRQVLLRPESGIELPGTLLCPAGEGPAPALLHLDDCGRHRLLERQGPLTRALGFLDRDATQASLLTVDLRGWGDTQVALYPYEMAGWGGADRYLAYTSAALGDSILAMRVRDALSALAYLRARPGINPDAIVLSGCGLGGVVARHVAVIDGGLQGLVVWDSLHSFEDLLAQEHPAWPQDAFMPNVLLHYDLPELTAAAKCPVAEFDSAEETDMSAVVEALGLLMGLR